MISAHYEEDGDSFQEEIKQLDSLRQVSLLPLTTPYPLYLHGQLHRVPFHLWETAHTCRVSSVINNFHFCPVCRPCTTIHSTWTAVYTQNHTSSVLLVQYMYTCIQCTCRSNYIVESILGRPISSKHYSTCMRASKSVHEQHYTLRFMCPWCTVKCGELSSVTYCTSSQVYVRVHVLVVPL